MRRCNKNKSSGREIRGKMGREEWKERRKECEIEREGGKGGLT